MRRSLSAGLITLALALCWSGTALADPNNDYAGSHMPRSGRQLVPPDAVFSAQKRVVGPDVSNHQGCSLDWNVIAKRRNFAFMKASEGLTFTDACFDRNWRQSRAVHLPRGAYDFARPNPDISTARFEADHFISVVKSSGGFHNALPPVLDIEVNDFSMSRRRLRSWIRAWIDELRRHTKRKTVVIYTFQDYWNTNIGKWRPKNVMLWGARWSTAQPEMVGWKHVNWWQYTDGSFGPKPHKCPGIGYSDQSFWLGSKSALRTVQHTP